LRAFLLASAWYGPIYCLLSYINLSSFPVCLKKPQPFSGWWVVAGTELSDFGALEDISWCPRCLCPKMRLRGLRTSAHCPRPP
jgi:hypothetical protein